MNMRYDPKLNSRIGQAVRCHGSPIISKQTHGGTDLSDLGKDPLSNINGPSVLRLPEWVANRLGKYYLYFAHHKGTSIRLAYADRMIGPWVVHPKPVLTVEPSLFVTKDLDPNSRIDWVNGPDYLYAHIASPDVHVDRHGKQILMFFHGLLPDGDQQTRLAVSENGQCFSAALPLLGPSYLRAFQWRGRWYSTHLWGEIGIFETLSIAPKTFSYTTLPTQITGATHAKIRHGHICQVGEHIHFVFSRVGDTPECILHCRIELSDDPQDWRFGPVTTLLSPDEPWEGFGRVPVISTEGSARGWIQELRDPCLFYDEGQLWLLYSGGVERGIGLAQVIRN
jgi:hypothetical protein